MRHKHCCRRIHDLSACGQVAGSLVAMVAWWLVCWSAVLSCSRQTRSSDVGLDRLLGIRASLMTRRQGRMMRVDGSRTAWQAISASCCVEGRHDLLGRSHLGDLRMEEKR